MTFVRGPSAISVELVNVHSIRTYSFFLLKPDGLVELDLGQCTMSDVLNSGRILLGSTADSGSHARYQSQEGKKIIIIYLEIICDRSSSVANMRFVQGLVDGSAVARR